MRLLTNHGKRDATYADGSVPSPDGKQIAYGWANGSAPHDLRVIAVTGGAPRILDPNREGADSITPVGWTSNGRDVLAVVQARRIIDLVMVPLSGTARRVIKRFENEDVANFRLSPDDRLVAFDRRVSSGAAQRDVFILSLESGSEVPIGPHPASEYVLDWFPDGKRLLFGSDRRGTYGMWAVAVSGGRAQGEALLVRADTGHVEGQNNGVAHVARFTKAGDFYFGILGRTEDIHIAALDPTTGVQAKPLARLDGRYTGSKRRGVWSPDGSRILYEFLSNAEGGARIGVTSLTTGQDSMIPMLLRSAGNAVWMPDGRHIICQGLGLQGQQGLFRLNVETGASEPIDMGSADISRSSPAVSSDGGQVYFAFTRKVAPTRGIGVRDLATGQERIVTTESFSTFALSPAVAGSGGMQMLLLDGPLRILTTNGQMVLSLSAAVAAWEISPPVAWGADGFSAYVVKRVNGVDEVWELDIAGGVSDTGIRWKGRITRLSPSPDGQRLALSVIADNPETWVLQNIPPAGGAK
jgi:dipeptidyl aminopeptidase/acylaminoacyl peptidase